jgi:hypothetical protein
MVRAILEGRKTHTRRIIKPCPWPEEIEPPYVAPYPTGAMVVYCDSFDDMMYKAAPFVVGDRLWVKETWQLHSRASDLCTVAYRASVNHGGWTEAHEQFPDVLAGQLRPKPFQEGWRSPLHMFRWASRLTLTVTDVRVERLQDISEADALAEGIIPAFEGFALTKNGECWGQTAKDAFRVLWDGINGNRKGASWNDNPWVVAISFDVAKRNIDQ